MRNLGRTIVFIGLLGIILSLGWWAIYYNEVVQALGGAKSPLQHPMRCLLWTADLCAQPAKVMKLYGLTVQAYMPAALWVSLALLILGLILVYVSTSTQPYPQTPVGEPHPVIGRLEPFYAWARDLSWPLIRVAAGGTLLAFGLFKVFTLDINAYAAKSLAARGLEPALILAYTIFFLETVGAVMIIIGLFTRFFAAMIAIEFFVITFFVQFNVGYGTARGWSMLLMWGLLFFAIALRGGGPYSLDRLLRREL
jgi:putative oxidoreductase